MEIIDTRHSIDNVLNRSHSHLISIFCTRQYALIANDIDWLEDGGTSEKTFLKAEQQTYYVQLAQ